LRAAELIAAEWKQCKVTGAFDRNGQLTLVMCAGAGYSAGQNLGSLRNKAAKLCNILVINCVDSVNTESADLFAGFASARTAVPVLSVVSVISIGHGKKPPFLINNSRGDVLERQIVV